MSRDEKDYKIKVVQCCHISLAPELCLCLTDRHLTWIMLRLLSQTTLRNILGTKTLHEILSDREEISGSMQVK